jgi:hypothetical protein
VASALREPPSDMPAEPSADVPDGMEASAFAGTDSLGLDSGLLELAPRSNVAGVRHNPPASPLASAASARLRSPGSPPAGASS